MAKVTYKKQFRLYDIYRYAVTGKESHINGLHGYEVNEDATLVAVRFTSFDDSKFFYANNEDELREIVREVNKRLNNCEKPGRKARRKR